MLRDWLTPPGAAPTATAVGERFGHSWERATWTPDSVSRLASSLTPFSPPPERRLAAWCETVDAFLDPGSAERLALDPLLAHLCRLSPAGLAAGLDAVLGGVAGSHAENAFAQAAGLEPPSSPVLAVLASNLPALAVQPLLPILALGRPAVVKSASAEPLFAAAFCAALVDREPALASSLAALTWTGGDAAIEERLLPAMGTVLAYGGEEAMAALRERLGAEGDGRLIAYGPKTSLAVAGAAASGAEIEALARDVALFDQRGCLSVAAVYTEGDAGALAGALADALADLARRWPPGPATLAEQAAVRQVRDEAATRGLARRELALDAGTVVVEPRPGFRPSPGLRTVRVHPVANLTALEAALAPWNGRLQGVAFAGVGETRRAALREALAPLGVSRFAAAGELQSPDARWHNGGVDPLRALA